MTPAFLYCHRYLRGGVVRNFARPAARVSGLSRVFFQVSTPDDPVNATLDDAHLYIVEKPDR